MLIRKFYFCSSSVKHRLFSTYFGNPYLCVLWVKFKKSVGKSVKVAFNNSFRILHNLNMRCSASEMIVLNNVRSYPEMYRKSVYSFMKRLICIWHCFECECEMGLSQHKSPKSFTSL